MITKPIINKRIILVITNYYSISYPHSFSVETSLCHVMTITILNKSEKKKKRIRRGPFIHK